MKAFLIVQDFESPPVSSGNGEAFSWDISEFLNPDCDKDLRRYLLIAEKKVLNSKKET